MDEWITDEKGDVIVFSLTGYQMARAFEMCAALQLQFSRAESETELRIVQLALTVPQLRALALDLIAAAEMLEKPPAADAPRN
ncbi:hypothetical protein [Methylovirgula sp. HY1]|uniref:hypothetical protein n=1 Tax=Methylovirgula sp. HY1 TaxID=2822761 RepID=UPI001C5AE958|nr:hypothetical protein [Methylovirgula sp. HY1]QXX74262.1 hypothetical protein MHY1_01072 [Methylovirgula sp. HY1]